MGPVGGRDPNQEMRSIGPVLGKAKAHSITNQSLTYRQCPRKSDLKITLIQAKCANRDPMMGCGRTICPRSLRSHGTSRCASCPPTPKSKALWKTTESENIWEGGDHLHIQYFVPIELAAFIRKKHMNCDFTAHNSLYHLQKGPYGTSIQIILLRRTDGGLRCNGKNYIRKGTPL